MPSPYPFTPGNSASLSVTNTTGNVALPTGTGSVLRICNDGTTTLYFNLGTSSAVTAALTNTPILGGAIELFSLNAGQTFLAGISSGADTGTLRLTRGEGA